jgi:putative transposase
MIVDRVEQIQIKHKNSLYSYCDELSFASKNLYNYGNYLIRQEFIKKNNWVRYNELYKLLKDHETYKSLPAQTVQQTLIFITLQCMSMTTRILRKKKGFLIR